MKYAQVIDGNVVNVIVWDGTTPVDLPGELINVDDTPCGPGWSYVDGEFVAPLKPDAPDTWTPGPSWEAPDPPA